MCYEVFAAIDFPVVVKTIFFFFLLLHYYFINIITFPKTSTLYLLLLFLSVHIGFVLLLSLLLILFHRYKVHAVRTRLAYIKQETNTRHPLAHVEVSALSSSHWRLLKSACLQQLQKNYYFFFSQFFTRSNRSHVVVNAR